MITITDEAVQAAAEVWTPFWSHRAEPRAAILKQARAALEAALPHLEAEALGEAAKVADDLAAGVANPEKLYNEAFIHACGVVARAIRDIGNRTAT